VTSDHDTIVVEQSTRSRAAIAAKRTVQMAFWLIVSPRLLCYWIGSMLWGKNRAFLAASESVSRIPGMRGVYARQAFYGTLLTECGKDVYFGWQSVFSMREARVGDNAYIGRRCSVGFGSIGANVMLADGVQVLSGGHEHGIADVNGESHQAQAQVFNEVRIDEGTWVGTNAVIMADVGAGSVIGAGAVVTRAIPTGTVAAGVPARIVRQVQ